ncbi:type II toxin-antitoxin system VapC family toxin [Candidatus Woesearchaeota archaeon]|nr:type II toxin-antitoxin system VapC family toxin [Candidatus Woesearchaeota archaeon]
MTLVLDTSLIIDIEQRKQSTITQLHRLSTLHPLPAKITFITEFEFHYGVRQRTPANKEQAIAVLHKFSVLHTSHKTAELLSELKHAHEKKGVTLPLADLLIATLAIENDMTLVTKDKDFQKIEELKSIIL